MLFKTLLIGLGQIGLKYDYNLSNKNFILSHAQAIDTHDSFELSCAVDPLQSNRTLFKEKFDLPVFSRINKINCFNDFDVVVIAVPTAKHFIVFEEIVKAFNPKLILLEKPISHNLNESIKIVEYSKENNIALAVNYFREFEPIHQKLMNDLRNNILGNPVKIICCYNRGILNNGSHFIKMFLSIFGNVISTSVLDSRKSNLLNDFEPTVKIIFEKGEIILIPLKQEGYRVNKMEIFGNKGNIKYNNGGSSYEYSKIVEDPIFKGHFKLSSKVKLYTTNINKYQYYIYDNIDQFFKKKSRIFCNGEDALEVLKVIDDLSINKEEEIG